MITPERFLYNQSPFRPQASKDSITHITRNVQQSVHPAVAIAQEVRYLSKVHSGLFSVELDWICEKFPIGDKGLRSYIYGLMIPSNLLLVVDLIQDYSYEEVFAMLINEEGEDWDVLTRYLARQTERARTLVCWDSQDPMVSGKPIYDLCALEVFDMNPWYIVGVEGGRLLFDSFAQLLNPSEV